MEYCMDQIEYCMDQIDSKFFIAAADKKRCLKDALRKLAHRKKRWWTKGPIQADTLQDLFAEFRWDVYTDDDGNINTIDFVGEKSGYGEDLEFLQSVAPFVREGSFIEMSGEDGQLWRWVFDGKTCIEKYPEINWG